MKQQTTEARDFSSISPSARWILLLKAHTNLPFAKEAAEIIERPHRFSPDFENSDAGFWGRTVHFEARYQSLDLLLDNLPVKNILELSSGFSFRGLDRAMHSSVHYIDTDLPEITAQKKVLMKELGADKRQQKGTLELLPLNALDEAAFKKTVRRFPAGELAVVNEGLLVYLNTEEKEKLCGIIRNVLKQRGGYWITGDVYLKLKPRNITLRVEAQMKRFFEEQRVEENRFDSFEAAEEFFNEQGFLVDKEAELDYTHLSSFPYLLKHAAPETLRSDGMPKIHACWRLRLA